MRLPASCALHTPHAPACRRHPSSCSHKAPLPQLLLLSQLLLLQSTVCLLVPCACSQLQQAPAKLAQPPGSLVAPRVSLPQSRAAARLKSCSVSTAPRADRKSEQGRSPPPSTAAAIIARSDLVGRTGNLQLACRSSSLYQRGNAAADSTLCMTWQVVLPPNPNIAVPLQREHQFDSDPHQP